MGDAPVGAGAGTSSGGRSGDPVPATVGSRDHLVLVGMMGAGKTTVGRMVADRLGRPFVDLDDEIHRVSGHTAPELLAAEGEAAFRSTEAEALARVLARPDGSVVATGGGAVVAAGTRDLLRRPGTGPVVWLRADPATLAVRVGDGAGRPLLVTGADPDPAAALRRIDGERRRHYEEVASVVVDVDGRTPQAVADRVLAGCAHGADVVDVRRVRPAVGADGC